MNIYKCLKWFLLFFIIVPIVFVGCAVPQKQLASPLIEINTEVNENEPIQEIKEEQNNDELILSGTLKQGITDKEKTLNGTFISLEDITPSETKKTEEVERVERVEETIIAATTSPIKKEQEFPPPNQLQEELLDIDQFNAKLEQLLNKGSSTSQQEKNKNLTPKISVDEQDNALLDDTASQNRGLNSVALLDDTASQEKISNSQDLNIAPPQQPTKLVPIKNAKKEYSIAYQYLTTKNYKTATKLFQQFIIKYPNSTLTDNAEYWLGRTYWILQDYDKAEQQFYNVLHKYEHKNTQQGYKTIDSILMLAAVSEKKENYKRARLYYRAIIQKFPNSPLIKETRKRLGNILQK